MRNAYLRLPILTSVHCASAFT